MSTDPYVKGVLTVIAGALVYLCIVITPWPAAGAQTAARPGDPTGPAQVVVVGWRAPQNEREPIVAPSAIPVTMNEPVRVTGQVTTERTAGNADRVVIVGWEERAELRSGPGSFQRFDSRLASGKESGLPVITLPRQP
jgi:hypothetical protein